jgi:hypothetical protein
MLAAANAWEPKIRCEVRESEIAMGRASERQLIAEAERIAASRR